MTFNEFRDALIREIGESETGRVLVAVSLSSKTVPYKPGAAVKRVMVAAGIKGVTGLRQFIHTALGR